MGYGSKGFDYVTISFFVSVSGWTPSIIDPFKDYWVSVGSVIYVSDFVSISYSLLSGDGSTIDSATFYGTSDVEA